MTRPAIIAGVYTDARFYAGLKVLRVSIEVPIEKAQEFFSAFGTPDKANPVSVVLARMQEGLGGPEESGPDSREPESLTTSTTAERSVSAPHAEPAKDQDKSRTLKRSNRAALLCKHRDFWRWLMDTYPKEWNAVYEDKQTNEEAAGKTLKRLLCIRSRADLDTDESAAEAWDRLETSFMHRGQVRE